jgi:AcrR family transcriptional regulator
VRADGRRNRARVLEAAIEVIDDKGVGFSTEQVAARAGLGIGTVFRHFPTKASLLAAVHLEQVRVLTTDIREIAEGGDPASAFFAAFELAMDRSATKNAVLAALAESGGDVDGAASAFADLRQDVARLLGAAQHAGVVRRDVGVDDVIALLVGASRSLEVAADADARRRLVAIFGDVLRS